VEVGLFLFVKTKAASHFLRFLAWPRLGDDCLYDRVMNVDQPMLLVPWNLACVTLNLETQNTDAGCPVPFSDVGINETSTRLLMDTRCLN